MELKIYAPTPDDTEAMFENLALETEQERELTAEKIEDEGFKWGEKI